MAQNVTIAGNQYPSVPSILIPKTGGGGNATFTDTSPTTASASDVAQGKIFFDSTGTQQTGTASGGGGTDFIVTLSYDSQSDMWLPDKTLSEIAAAYSAGKTIASYAYDENLGYAIDSSCYYDNEDGTFWYEVINVGNDGSTSYVETFYYYLDGNGVASDGTYKTYDTYDATAVPAEVANGRIFYNANGRQTGTASGGASNIVTGTFKGTTTNAAMDITLNYSGSGYPICVIVFPTGGIVGNSSFHSLVHQYAIGLYSVIKRNMVIAPMYSGSSPNDDVTILRLIKSSASNATNYSGSVTATAIYTYKNEQANSSTNQWLKICSATKLSVYIAAASYGFPANIEYTYYVIYS